MKLFFTSDWHLGHAASIEFDKRPFRDTDHMRESLITRFNATVPEDGTTYFLGDMAFGNNQELKDTLSRLNGTKIMILGNHDRGVSASYAAGFSAVLHSASFFLGQNRVTMSHCPMLGVFREDVAGMRGVAEGENWHGESRQGKFSVEDVGQFHLHGHIHSGPANTKATKLGMQWDVGCPGNNYTPVSYSQVESWVMRTIQGR